MTAAHILPEGFLGQYFCLDLSFLHLYGKKRKGPDCAFCSRVELNTSALCSEKLLALGCEAPPREQLHFLPVLEDKGASLSCLLNSGVWGSARLCVTRASARATGQDRWNSPFTEWHTRAWGHEIIYLKPPPRTDLGLQPPLLQALYPESEPWDLTGLAWVRAMQLHS